MSFFNKDRGQLTMLLLGLILTYFISLLQESLVGGFLLCLLGCLLLGYLLFATDKAGEFILLGAHLPRMGRVAVMSFFTIVPPLLVAHQHTNIFRPASPSFEIAESILHPDSAIVIRGQNVTTTEAGALDIVYDGIPFDSAAYPLNASGGSVWSFALKRQPRYSSLLTEEGHHYVRIGAHGEFADTTFTILLASDYISRTGGGIEVHLHEGWNLIAYPFNKRVSPGKVFSSIQDSSLIVEDAEGDIYYPSLAVNELEMLEPGLGYRVYVSKEQDLEFSAERQLLGSGYKIQLDEGWNIVGYYLSDPMPVKEAFKSIEAELATVKDEGGHMYIPSAGIEELEQLRPYRAYFVYVNSAVTLSF